MFALGKTAVKYFVYGLIAGILIAPESGARTRQLLMNKLRSYWRGAVGLGAETTRQAAGTVSEAAQRAEESTQRAQPQGGQELH